MSETVLSRLLGEEADLLEETNFQLLLLANVSPTLGLALVSPLISTLAGVYAVSPEHAGLLMSALTAPSIVLIPLVGAVADRVGRKPVLVVGLLVYGLAGCALALTTDFRMALALRFLQGVGYVGLVPIIVTSFGDLYAGAREATAQGLRFTVTGVSQTVFPLVAGVLVAVAWQYPFLIFGIAVPTALVLAVFLDEPSDPDRTVGDDARTVVRRVAATLRSRKAAAVLVARGLPPFLYFGFLTYVSVVVGIVGGGSSESGLVVAITSLTFAVAATQVGRVTDRFAGRATPIVLTHGVMSVGLAIFAFAPSLAVAAVGAVLVGVGIGVNVPLYRSALTALSPEAVRGSVVSVGEAMGRLSVTVVPVFMGALVGVLEPAVGFDQAVRWTVLAVALVTVVAGPLLVLFARRAPAVPDPT
ncbi:MAG: MFS transporter [Haloarculaceae archaeon]